MCDKIAYSKLSRTLKYPLGVYANLHGVYCTGGAGLYCRHQTRERIL
nr:MAG TPA: hypothetical protein [Caudoviricetes sp.]